MWTFTHRLSAFMEAGESGDIDITRGLSQCGRVGAYIFFTISADFLSYSSWVIKPWSSRLFSVFS